MDQATREQTTAPHDIAALNECYFDGDQADPYIFSEMRSNILLVAGEHYQKRQSSFYKRIRDSRELSSEQKMRLTKNHIQKITKTYANNILSLNPGVGFEPKIEGDLHQQKICDLNHSLWRHGHQVYSIDDKQDDWCDEFIQTGEVHVKIFYDKNKGTQIGYEALVDETGQPVLDETGQQQPDESKPVFKGAFIFEEVFGFNLLRPSECRDISQAEWLCVRKMMSSKDLKSNFKDPEVQKFIVPTSEETYVIFDGAQAGYKRMKDQVMVREYYFRPCPQYPKGWYAFTTKEGILEEGELPGGIFPIITELCEKVPTSPRGRSPVRIMRPYQAEINRSASKIAEHQVTLGDDKLLIQNGTKVSTTITLPGVRAMSYTGMTPVVMPGRDGSQYLNYMLSQVKELYEVMNTAEDAQEIPGQLDPYTLLFRSARQKKKFQRYIKRFEKFLIKLVKTYLTLCKIHLTDEDLLEAFGKREQVNIPEYRQSKELDFDVKVEAQSDDVETKLGKQLVMNHMIQYVGPQLKSEDIGKLMRAMPYADKDASFDDFTLDFDTVTDEILALDRGEVPPVAETDNHAYAAKRLRRRMGKSDFKFLDPQIQMHYKSKLAIHQQIDGFQKMAIQRAEQGFIPTGGYLVPCDFYVQDPNDATGVKTRRARFPYQAIEWLAKQLEVQGQGQQQMEAMDQGQQADYAKNMLSAGMPTRTSPSSPSGGGSPMPSMGMPGGHGTPGMPPMGRSMGSPQLPPGGFGMAGMPR